MDERTPLIDLGRVLLRGWWIILLVTLLCVGGAVAGRYLLTEKYDATAVLTIQSITSESDVNMETEQVVATSGAVLDQAAREVGTSATTLEGSVSALVPKDSQALRITATSTSPELAARTANAVARAYQENRVRAAQSASDAAVADLGDRVEQLRARLADESTGSATADALRSQIALLENQTATLLSRTVQPGEVISPATAPGAASTPSYEVFAAGGLALGVIAGFFLALVVDRVRLERESIGRGRRVSRRKRRRQERRRARTQAQEAR